MLLYLCNLNSLDDIEKEEVEEKLADQIQASTSKIKNIPKK